MHLNPRNKRHPFILFLALGLLLVSASLACTAVSRINETRGTAAAVITSAQGLATEGSSLLGTARAFATENPEAVQTARSFVTTQGPALVSSAQAFATENPGVVQTAQALITSVPGAVETAASGIVSGSTSDLHSDIPVLPEPQRLSYLETDTSVIYSTQYLTRRGVEDYYLSQMPVYDWRYDPDASQQDETSTLMTYRKGNRTAQVIILPVDPDITSITINLSSQ